MTEIKPLTERSLTEALAKHGGRPAVLAVGSTRLELNGQRITTGRDVLPDIAALELRVEFDPDLGRYEWELR